MNLLHVPDCIPRARGGFSRQLGIYTLKIMGWHFAGELPQQKKFILAVAPHTSNWDFVLGIASILALNLNVKFMGKKAIFIWPFKYLLYGLGGIAIDRTNNHGVVGQMVNAFNEQEQLILGLAPEGTRSKTVEWKTGFLHIASKAKVPVLPVSLDYDKKEIKFHSPCDIGEDIPAELQRIKNHFSSVCAKNPQAV